VREEKKLSEDQKGAMPLSFDFLRPIFNQSWELAFSSTAGQVSLAFSSASKQKPNF